MADEAAAQVETFLESLECAEIAPLTGR